MDLASRTNGPTDGILLESPHASVFRDYCFSCYLETSLIKNETIFSSFLALLKGLGITMSHLVRALSRRRRAPITPEHPDYFKQEEGISTLLYPHEALPVPDHGRYQLHNEIEDCIVCDKCAKICPVDCIEIEAVKSPVEIGRTSDGSPKRLYAAKFNIDMAKCCFCGLCTVVCPTECLTMTPVYDFSVTDVKEHIFDFSELTAEEAEQKKKEYEAHLQAKKEASEARSEQSPAQKPVKPVFRPVIKPKGTS